MATAVNSNPPPNTQLQTAYDRFRRSVRLSDAVSFEDTTLDDVWKEATTIQESRRKQQASQNIRRLEPFLQGIEKYAKALEVICNGTPYIAWIWGPIKLMLQLASEHSNVFEKLLVAYTQIAENMPNFDRLRLTFKDDENFKSVLAMIYTDIMDFHRRAYKFFTRRKWEIFFDALWKDFESRFNGIIERLARHKQLLMNAVIAIDVTEARSWRIQQQEALKERQKRRKGIQLQASIEWLHVEDERQEDEIDKLSQRRQPGTGQWITGNTKLLSWINDANVEPILWLKGIPGAGKSVLCTSVIEFLTEKPNITTAYYLCNSYTDGRPVLAQILQSLIAQILRRNKKLAPFVFENYANCGLPPSVKTTRKLLAELVSTVDDIRICIDGLDEISKDEDQKLILQEFAALTKLPGEHCRVLFSNRESSEINRFMSRKRTISLKEESINVKKDIMIYVEEKISGLRSSGSFPDSLIDDVKRKVVEKAQGMFLWVRLVFINLDDCYNAQELEDTVEKLPDGLDEAYGRILDRIKELRPAKHQKAIRMLQFMAASFRTLKLFELQDGIVIRPGNPVLDEHNRIDGADILDLCKPLIEQARGNKVDFVHYSAKEFILHIASGPFVVGTEAHYQIAFSCISYLSTSSYFYDISTPKDLLRIRVIKRFHGLHHYANNFWYEHLLEAARSPLALNEEILAPTRKLVSFWKEGHNADNDYDLLAEEAVKDELADRLAALNSYPEIKWMVHEMLAFRKSLKDALVRDPSKTPEEFRAVELKKDPTQFSNVNKRYQDTVQLLIGGSDLPASITTQEYKKFKSTYSDLAFLCRSIDCAHSIDGFKTESARNIHEISKHVTILRCTDSTCERYVSGFTNRRSLLKHNRTYHPEPPVAELPAFGVPASISEDETALDETTDEPAQIKYTAVRKRVSKAKKGLPVHVCEICQPPTTYTRAENLRRHQLTHQTPMYCCPLNGCGKPFHRPDLLALHIKAHEKKAAKGHKRRRLGSPSSSANSSEPVTPSSSSHDMMANVPAGPVNQVVQELKHTDSTNTNASAFSSSQTLNTDTSMSTSVSGDDSDVEISGN